MKKLIKTFTTGENPSLDLKLCYTHGKINETQYDKLCYLLHQTTSGTDRRDLIISKDGIQLRIENIKALIKGIEKDMQKFQEEYGKGYTYCYIQPRKEIISLLKKLYILIEQENVEYIHYRITDNEYYPNITQWNLIF